ncbi:hypothetical protein LTR64_000263 [Lithohypha guttulata]|uniref:uncharacterized protein n=1 Tax=Lithohypha guttulata TaxID=1690604 RepID=UPI00315D6F5C
MIPRGLSIKFSIGLLCFVVILWASSWSGVAKKSENSIAKFASSVGSTFSSPKTNFGTPGRPYTDTKFDGAADLENFQKPGRIAAFILAGRREFVPLLNCYLERNLVRNGGWLDEVLWIIRTDHEDDRAFVRELVERTPEYISFETRRGDDSRHYDTIYKQCRNDTIYIKIDDDVVFWEDHAIPAIVKRLVENPQYLGISANVMNQPALSWVHYHLGTARPFAPETTPPEGFVDLDQQSPMPIRERIDWRPSSLPQWTGPKNFSFGFHFTEPAPFKHHRWLPLPKDFEIEDTPMGKLGEGHSVEYSAGGIGWKSWTIAAQEHMSFLTHLENQELYHYKFDIWHYHYERISINFFAFHGSLVLDNPIEGQDEEFLTTILVKRLKRPAIMDGTAMAVHFGFGRQFNRHAFVKSWQNVWEIGALEC